MSSVRSRSLGDWKHDTVLVLSELGSTASHSKHSLNLHEFIAGRVASQPSGDFDSVTVQGIHQADPPDMSYKSIKRDFLARRL